MKSKFLKLVILVISIISFAGIASADTPEITGMTELSFSSADPATSFNDLDFTMPTGANNAIVVAVGVRANEVVDEITYGGELLTRTNLQDCGGIGKQRVDIWAKPGVPVGTKKLIINYSSNSKQRGISVFSVKNVNPNFLLDVQDSISGSCGNSANAIATSTPPEADTLSIGFLNQRKGTGGTNRFTAIAPVTEIQEFSKLPSDSSPAVDTYGAFLEINPSPSPHFFQIGTNPALADDWALGILTLKKAPKFFIKGHIQTTDGTPISGVSLTVTGDVSASTSTDGSGNYQAGPFPTSTAFTIIPSKSGFSFNPISITDVIQFSDFTADFTAIASTYTVSGTIKEGATPLQSIQVDLQIAGGNKISTSTASDGTYSFGGIVHGSDIAITPKNPAYTFAPIERTATNLTADLPNQDFVATLNTYTVSGTVLENASGFSGATITMQVSGGGSSTTTSAGDGSYSFSGVPYGTEITLTPSLPAGSHNFSPVTRANLMITADLPGQDFEALIKRYNISGTVTENGNPLSGTKINLEITGGTNVSTTTLANGTYSFTNLPHGTIYNIVPEDVSKDFAPSNKSGTLTGNVIQDFVATTKVFTINGTVTKNGSPLSGVTLTLTGDVSASTSTNGSGQYSFASIPYGSSYTVTPSHPSTIFDPVNKSGVIVSNVVADFVATELFEISGTVRLSNLDQTPVKDVVVKNETSGTETTTDDFGNYSFADLIPGAYKITALEEGYYVNPAELNPTIVDSDVEDQDFLLTPVLESPVISQWTGFLETVNVSELSNLGTKSVNVSIKLFQDGGLKGDLPPVSQVDFKIPAMSQKDIIINDMFGFEKDRYGFILIEFDANTIAGRTFYYRESQEALGIATPAQDDFEYTYPVAYSNFNNEGKTTYVMFNTFNPSINAAEADHTVGSWITLGNLDPEKRQTFTLNGYLSDGTLFKTFDIRLRPFQRVDTFGFHEPGNPGPNKIGMVEIIPHGTGSYFAMTNRYGTTSPAGIFPHTWRFATSFLSREATERSQFLGINSQDGASNVIELANPLATPSTIVLDFYNGKGTKVFTKNVSLKAHEVKHIFANTVLTPGENGLLKLTPNAGSAFVAYSITYRNNQSNGRIDAVDVSQTDEPFGTVAIGNYNLFLNQSNPLRVMNISNDKITVTLDVLDIAGNIVSTKNFELEANSTEVFSLEDTAEFGTLANTNSTFSITAPPGSVFAELLRIKPYAGGGIDFSATTLTSPSPN